MDLSKNETLHSKLNPTKLYYNICNFHHVFNTTYLCNFIMIASQKRSFAFPRLVGAVSRCWVCGRERRGPRAPPSLLLWKWQVCEAGRVDGGWDWWQHPPPLSGSTPDRLHQMHRWWSSPCCRVILLPPFRLSTARDMSSKPAIICNYYFHFFFKGVMIQRTECGGFFVLFF